jgi:uncharacterized protein YbcV (DUF1398 family)
VFMGAHGTALSAPLAGTDHADLAPRLDAAAVIRAITRQTMDRTPPPEFRSEVALAGVQYYDVNMNARTCTYIGTDGAKHVGPVRMVAA